MVNPESELELLREKYLADLAFMSRTAMELVELPLEEDIYRFVGEKLCRLAGDHFVLINSIDSSTGRIVVRAVLGLGPKLQSVLNLLGRDPVGMSFPISQEAKQGLTSGRLVKVPGGIYGLTFGLIPQSLCKAIERIGGVGEVFSMGFANRGELFGNAVIIARSGVELKDSSTLETFMNQASVVIQRRRVEEALLESEARFRRLAENAHDLIYRYELDPVRGFSYVSQAVSHMLGYSPEEFYADPDIPRKLVHPDDLPIYDAARDQATSQPSSWRWRHKDGHEVWTEHLRVPVFDETGAQVAFEGIVRDITERKQLEEQLLRAQRLEAAGRIAGQVAHDFNNLLGPLVAYPELIKMQLPEGHAANQYCDSMLEAAERMADINEDMMALGRRGHFDQESVDLNGLVRQVVAQMANFPPNLTLEMDLASGLLSVNGSPAQLMRVISNLLSNARDAMQDLGLLTIRTENVYTDRTVGNYNRIDAGEYVKLSVSDTGCGIAPEVRDKVFDAFFTTKSRVNRRGCGLGLSIVQAIVEDHLGYVDLESEVGIGTTFSVYLPAVRVQGAELHPEQLQSGRERVLVVDDDRLQREVLRTMLSKLGYQVRVATSGEEALAQLRHESADLLVLDMIMPGGIDGAETYRQVLEIAPRQRAIVLSGFSESDRVREAQSLGAGSYLRKPVTLERLAKVVRGELDQLV